MGNSNANKAMLSAIDKQRYDRVVEIIEVNLFIDQEIPLSTDWRSEQWNTIYSISSSSLEEWHIFSWYFDKSKNAYHLEWGWC